MMHASVESRAIGAVTGTMTGRWRRARERAGPTRAGAKDDRAESSSVDQKAMDAAWELNSLGQLNSEKKESTNEESKTLERRNKALAQLLDQSLLDRRQLERALNKTIDAVRDENVSLRIEIERVKMDAERMSQKERAQMYAQVETEISARVRRGMEKQTEDAVKKLRSEAERAQKVATEQAESAAALISKLEKTVRTEALEQVQRLKSSFEQSKEADEAKITALKSHINSLEDQVKAYKEFTADYERVRDARDKFANSITDRDEKILALTSALDDANKRASEALTRATEAESKITKMSETVESRVKMITTNAETTVKTALAAQKVAEAKAEESKRMSEALISAAVVRAETAEAQLYRQSEILEEYATMTAAKTKAMEIIVQLKEKAAAQTQEIDELVKIVEISVREANAAKAELSSIKQMTERRVKESLTQAKEIQTSSESRSKLVLSETNSQLEDFDANMQAKELELEALRREVERLSQAAAQDCERLQREIRVQTELANTWRTRAEFMSKGRLDETDIAALSNEERSRLKSNFSGKQLRAFMADDWTLPEEHASTWEHGGFTHKEATPKPEKHSFDPQKEKANSRFLGTTGWSARKPRRKSQ